MLVTTYFFVCFNNNEAADGVIPGNEEASPSVLGEFFNNMSLTSFDRPAQCLALKFFLNLSSDSFFNSLISAVCLSTYLS